MLLQSFASPDCSKLYVSSFLLWLPFASTASIYHQVAKSFKKIILKSQKFFRKDIHVQKISFNSTFNPHSYGTINISRSSYYYGRINIFLNSKKFFFCLHSFWIGKAYTYHVHTKNKSKGISFTWIPYLHPWVFHI